MVDRSDFPYSCRHTSVERNSGSRCSLVPRALVVQVCAYVVGNHLHLHRRDLFFQSGIALSFACPRLSVASALGKPPLLQLLSLRLYSPCPIPASRNVPILREARLPKGLRRRFHLSGLW